MTFKDWYRKEYGIKFDEETAPLGVFDEYNEYLLNLELPEFDISEEYMKSDIVGLYIERYSLGLETNYRTLTEYLIDEYEMQSFFLTNAEGIINDLQRLLMKIRNLDTTSDEIKKEIDSTVVGMF